MAQRILQIVETAYRANLEEQDDPVLWLSTALRNAGGTVDILLRGAAVHYASRAQDALGLAIGGWQQTEPPRIAQDLARLVGKGAKIFVLEDDVDRRGLPREEIVDSVTLVRGPQLPGLLREYEQVWQW